MASIVPCHHNQFGTYPETMLPSSTSNIIEATLVRHEFHQHGGVDKIDIGYRASTPMESASINPYCQECEKSLLMHLTMDLPLSLYSAELVVQHLKHLVHCKHAQLQEAHKGLEPGCVWFDRVHYNLYYYFETDSDQDDEEEEGVTPVGFGSERLVKVTVDGDWALYFS